MLNMVSYFNLFHFVFQWSKEFCLLSLPVPTSGFPYIPSSVNLKLTFACWVFFLLLTPWIWINRLWFARNMFFPLGEEAYLGSPAPIIPGHFPFLCHCLNYSPGSIYVSIYIPSFLFKIWHMCMFPGSVNLLCFICYPWMKVWKGLS